MQKSKKFSYKSDGHDFKLGVNVDFSRYKNRADVLFVLCGYDRADYEIRFCT